MKFDFDYLFDRIYGGIIGQALGDAYAMPAYFRPEDTWSYYGGWINEFKPGPLDHPVHAGLEPGEITDDTQQAIFLVREILNCHQVTVEMTVNAILKWYKFIDGDNNPHVGPSSRRAIQSLLSGGDPYKTGEMGDTNGGAMRISPIGLINPGNIDQAIKDSVTVCTPTHATSVAISGGAAIASAVSAAIIPGSSLDSIISAGIGGANEGRKFGNTWLGANIARRIALAVEIARKEDDTYKKIINLYDIIGSTLATSEAVPAAFGIFALAEGDPMTCARYAAALSGDADTVAAMACAMAGSWKGIGSFPQEIVNTLEKVNGEYKFRKNAIELTKYVIENRIQ